MKDSIEKIREKFLEGLEDSAANAAGQQKTAPEGGGKMAASARYSIKNTSQMSLSEQLKRYYSGKLKSSDSLYLGNTPNSITSSGLQELPLAFPVSDFKKSTQEKHNVPRRAIKALHSDLSNAWFSFGKDGRIGFLTPDIDGDGKPLLIGIQANVQMDRSPVNAIRSVYGLDNPAEWIKNQISNGMEFTVYNKKEANSFLQTYGYSASVGGGIELLENSVSQSDGSSQGETKKVSIRYQERDPELNRVNEALRTEKEGLRDEFDRTKAVFDLLNIREQEGIFTQGSLEAVAKGLKQKSGATGSTKELAGLLQEGFQSVIQMENPSWADVEDSMTV